VHVAHRRLVRRDAHQQEAVADPIEKRDARPGDLVFLGPRGRAHHVAFWLGEGRILHATEREDAAGVVEEELARTVGDDPVRFARS